jgi:dolichol kinase
VKLLKFSKPFLEFRKLFHVVAASLIPLFYWYSPFPLTRFQVRNVIIIICGLGLMGFGSLDFWRLKKSKFNAWVFQIASQLFRLSEYYQISGATYLCLSFGLVTVIFPRVIAITAMLFLALGDSAAELGGKYLGSFRVGRKSLEGSLCFFIIAFCVAWLVLGSVWVAVWGAGIGAGIEMISNSIDDNLTVPLGSAVVLWILMLKATGKFL